MNKLSILLFLFSNLIFGQSQNTTNLATVSNEKMNIVYRGIRNPLSISVSDAKSFTAQGLGLSFEDGKYYLSPGQGLESVITLNIVKNDASEIIEKKVFRIKNLPRFFGTINDHNGKNCIVQMTKSRLETAVISTSADDFPIDLNLKVKSFSIKLGKRKTILCDGNTFNEEAISEINKLKTGSILTISEIRYRVNFDGCVAAMVPIQVQIIKEEVPFFETEEFKKDSLNDIKRLKRENRKHKKNLQISLKVFEASSGFEPL